jgi:hypothetical protein
LFWIMPCRSTMGPRLPKSRKNFLSAVNCTSVSPGPSLQPHSSRSVKMVCTCFGQRLPVPKGVQNEQVALDVEFQHCRGSGFSGWGVTGGPAPRYGPLIDGHAGDRPRPIVGQGRPLASNL